VKNSSNNKKKTNKKNYHPVDGNGEEKDGTKKQYST